MADSHIHHPDTTWVRTVKDLFAGAAGGIAQVLLGIRNPFKTAPAFFEPMIAALSFRRTPRAFRASYIYNLFLSSHTVQEWLSNFSMNSSTSPF